MTCILRRDEACVATDRMLLRRALRVTCILRRDEACVATDLSRNPWQFTFFLQSADNAASTSKK